MTEEIKAQTLARVRAFAVEFDNFAAKMKDAIPPEILEIAQRQTEAWQKATAQFPPDALRRLEAAMAMLRDLQKRPAA